MISVLDIPNDPRRIFVDPQRHVWGKIHDGRIVRQAFGKFEIFDRDDPWHYEKIASIKVREVSREQGRIASGVRLDV